MEGVNIREFEQQVFDLEGISIVLRAGTNLKVQPYHYTRQAKGTFSLREFIDQRIKPFVGDIEVVVKDGYGTSLPLNMVLNNARNRYMQ